MMKTPRGQTAKMRAYQQAYRAANPRDRRAYKKAYDETHKEQNAAYQKTQYARRKERMAAYYIANREVIIARVKARDAANPERVSEYHAEHYERNADRIKKNVRTYQKANRDKVAHLGNARRLRKIGNGGSHTLEEWQAKKNECGNACFYCKARGNLTRDHMIPIKRGGTDDISNIVPACRSCNSRKNARTAEEFITRQRA